MNTEAIRAALFSLQDIGYRDFQRKLLPTVAPETVIGVRTPELRKLARQLMKTEEIDVFLKELPHAYFDENQLHAFLLSEMKDFGACLSAVNRFLPHVDNWATCDQLSPKIFRKHRAELLDAIKIWLASNEPYTVRFGLGMLMEHFLDAAEVQSEEYYVRMMAAWFFATALAKQYDAALPYLEQRVLDPWTHKKTIQKAIESYRISPDQKAYLRGLKV